MLLRHDAPEPAVCSQRLPPDWPVPGSALLRHAWDHPPMHQARGGLLARGGGKSWASDGSDDAATGRVCGE